MIYPLKAVLHASLFSVVLYLTLIRVGMRKDSVCLYWHDAFDQIDKVGKEEPQGNRHPIILTV